MNAAADEVTRTSAAATRVKVDPTPHRRTSPATIFAAAEMPDAGCGSITPSIAPRVISGVI